MVSDFVNLKTAGVYGIYGHLGGGKSLTAVEIARDFLRRGFTIVSNIAIKHDDLPGRFDLVEDFSKVDFWSLPCGAPRGSPSDFRSAVIIDECAEFFDQYSSNSPFVKTFLSWLRHSSKRGQFVFLIVQQPEFIAKSLRLIINRWIVCVDLGQVRLPGIRLGLPFLSGFVWRRLFDRWGNLISRGLNLGSKTEIGRYYDTSQSIAVAGHQNDFVDKPIYTCPALDFFRAALFVCAVLFFAVLVFC